MAQQQAAVQTPVTAPPAAKITPVGALCAIEKQYPAEAALLKGIVENNVMVLGTDQAFALRDSEGEIRCYKQRLHLSQKEGTLVQPVPGGPHVVSAQGYEVWSEAAGACVIFPSEVLVDGKWQQNPYVYRDAKNGRVLAIYCRAISFRFSSKGIPQVADWTTLFDTPSYRLIDLLSKAKQFPQAFRLLPVGMKPEADGTWASYPFDENTTLWINTSHNEALTWYSQILNREKKAIDFAQTFARRNSLKHLSGLQKAPGPEWDITVLCWRPTGGNIIKWDATQYANLQKRVGAMISGDRSEFKAIELVSGAESVAEDPHGAALEATIDPEDVPPELGCPEQPGQPTDGLHATDNTEKKPEEKPEKAKAHQAKAKPTQNGKMTEEEVKILNNVKVAKEQFPDVYAQALKNLNLQSVASALTASKVMGEMNKIIDTQNQ